MTFKDFFSNIFLFCYSSFNIMAPFWHMEIKYVWSNVLKFCDGFQMTHRECVRML